MSPVISPEYAEMNRQLHAALPDYGTAGHIQAKYVIHLCRKYGQKVVLDYGCGKGTLKPAVAGLAPEITVLEFDPAIAGKDVLPSQSVDLIVALDVMEHIEPQHLGAVLQAMKDLKPKSVFLGISTHPANKILPDGRNAHLIVEPPEWWLAQLAPYFTTIEVQEGKNGHVIYRGAPRSD